MSCRRSVRQPTGELFHVEHACVIKIKRERFVFLAAHCFQERKSWRRLIAFLHFKRFEIDGIAVQATRGPCFETARLEPKSANTVTQIRSDIGHPTSGFGLFAYMQ